MSFSEMGLNVDLDYRRDDDLVGWRLIQPEEFWKVPDSVYDKGYFVSRSCNIFRSEKDYTWVGFYEKNGVYVYTWSVVELWGECNEERWMGLLLPHPLNVIGMMLI